MPEPRPCPHVTWERTLIMPSFQTDRVPIAVRLRCADCGESNDYFITSTAAGGVSDA